MEKKPSEKSPVQNLQESINQVIALQAKNLLLIAKGEMPDFPIDQKVWADLVKVVDLMPKFIVFDELCNAHVEVSESEKPLADGSAFEQISKRVKDRLNGKTAIGTKEN